MPDARQASINSPEHGAQDARGLDHRFQRGHGFRPAAGLQAAEAARIPDKHLLTLEPSISENQTDEMKAERVQLVLPRSLHPTYTAAQQAWLMDVESFTTLVKQRQIPG